MVPIPADGYPKDEIAGIKPLFHLLIAVFLLMMKILIGFSFLKL